MNGDALQGWVGADTFYTSYGVQFTPVLENLS